MDAQQQPATSTVTVDQRSGGGQYRLLGEFDFADLASVTLTDAADGFVIADGIRLEAMDAAPNEAIWTLVADDTAEYFLDLRWTAHPNRASDATYTIRRDGVNDVVYTANQTQGMGEWTTAVTLNLAAGEVVTVSLSDRANGYVIADAVRLVRTDAARNRITWPLDIPMAGDYRLEARWTAHPNRASNATYVVETAAGPQSVTVNQREGGAVWQPLGTFSLDGDSRVSVSDDADGFVVADGIRVVWAETAENQQALANSGSQLVFFHNDHLGAPQVITDEHQQVVWQGDYLPFGEVTTAVAAVENPIRFPGQYYDAETGLHYNYFRDYDPGLGRYVQSDPIGLHGGLNTYVYASQNALSHIDPLGLKVQVSPELVDDYQRLKNRSESGRQYCEQLENSDVLYSVKPTKVGNRYDPASNTIYYNPNLRDLRDLSRRARDQLGNSNWATKRPPEIGLAHETAHAVNDDNNTLLKNGLQAEQNSAIDHENRVRTDYGLPLRPHSTGL